MNLLVATFIIGLTSGTSHSQVKGVWPADFAKKAPMVSTSVSPRIKVLSGDLAPTTPEQEKMLTDYHDGHTLALRTAKDHLSNRRYGPARQLLEDRLRQYPWEESSATILADAYFRTRDYKKAYVLLEPFASPLAERSLLLRASLAVSLANEDYSGQKEYCLRAILDHFSMLENIPGCLPTDSSNRTLRFLSGLAVGIEELGHADYDNAVFYIEGARGAISNSAVADELLGSSYLALKDYAASVKAFERGLPLAKGALKDRIGRELATAKRLLDQSARPQSNR